MPCTVDITVERLQETVEQGIYTTCETVELTVQESACAAPGGGGAATVSPQPDNRLVQLHDGLYVSDDLSPDPLAYYILAKS